jgi:hypothetical protein
VLFADLETKLLEVLHDRSASCRPASSGASWIRGAPFLCQRVEPGQHRRALAFVVRHSAPDAARYKSATKEESGVLVNH